MAVIETWYNQDLQQPVKVRYLDGSMFSHNGNGNRIGVRVYNDGEPVTLTGTVSGYVITSDGSTVPCVGARSGNEATITIPPAAYQPGNAFITIFLTDGSTVTTLCAAQTTVLQARTGSQVSPGSVVQDWTQTINAAMQDVQTAADNLGGIVATQYASLTYPVPLGKYTYYNGNLYRCISAIAASEEFTAAHWTQVRLGDDVTDLKSATAQLRGALTNGMDLNDIYENGWYYSNNSAVLLHQPDEATGRRIVFVYGDSHPGSTEILYMIFYNASTGMMAFRYHNPSTGVEGWMPWQIIAKNDELTALKEFVIGDYTSKLTNGSNTYWKTDGTKAESSIALCTVPIFVPKGWGLKVSTAIGSSSYGVCEVTVGDAFVSGIHVGSCYNYVFISDHDCYMAVSSVSTQLPDLARGIYLLMPEEIPSEEIRYTENKAFDSLGFRYGYYTSDHVYTAHSSLECCDFRVKPGDWITANVAIQSNKDAIYIKYDDGTVEAVVGENQSQYLNYDLIAEKNGVCYISSYYPSGGSPSFSISSITDKNKNKRTCAIFKKVVCCGDSYTAGWIDDDGTAVRNNPNFNFPHYMSTLTGNEWVDCGASGTTVLSWQTNTNGYQTAKTTGKSQAYIIGLGINDRGSVPIGTTDDIGTDAETYYGGMSQIVIKLAAISPDAAIFINTNPNAGNLTGVDERNEAIRTLVGIMKENYRVHVIDLAKYTAFYHRPGFLEDFLQGHFTAIGYEQFAELYVAIMSEYINHHVSEFQDVAFLSYDSIDPDTLDMVLTDNSAVDINSNATGCNVYGKYLSIGGKVYFKVAILMTADISSTIDNIFSNLPEPSYEKTIFDEKNPTSVKQKPHVRWATSRWLLSVASGFSKGDTAMFYGVYNIAT